MNISLSAAAAFGGVMRPGVLDENLTHEVGSDGEEVTAIFPVWLGVAGEPEEGFMDERRGFERMAGALTAQATGSQAA